MDDHEARDNGGDGIEHLDFNPDAVQRLAMASSAAVEELGESVDQAVIVLHIEGGGTRVFWIGHPDHAYVTLERGVKSMKNVLS